MDNRYARQRVLKYIGKEGQEKLGASRAAIVGMGALGSVQANLLARAGVGYLRLIDRANENGGRDNIAAVYLKIVNGKPASNPPAGGGADAEELPAEQA